VSGANNVRKNAYYCFCWSLCKRWHFTKNTNRSIVLSSQQCVKCLTWWLHSNSYVQPRRFPLGPWVLTRPVLRFVGSSLLVEWLSCQDEKLVTGNRHETWFPSLTRFFKIICSRRSATDRLQHNPDSLAGLFGAMKRKEVRERENTKSMRIRDGRMRPDQGWRKIDTPGYVVNACASSCAVRFCHFDCIG